MNNDIDRLTYKDVTISCIHSLREKSVIVYMPDGETRSIPRSCLSYQCDKKLEDLTFDVTAIQVVDWFCQKEDL
jgi:hypothetical protein